MVTHFGTVFLWQHTLHEAEYLVRLHCFHREPVYKYKYCLHENEDKNEEKQIVFFIFVTEI